MSAPVETSGVTTEAGQSPVLRAMLLALVPLALLVFGRVHARAWTWDGPGVFLLPAAAMLVLAAISSSRIVVRVFALGVLGPIALAFAPGLVDRPLLSLILIIAATSWVERVFTWTRVAPRSALPPVEITQARGVLTVWALSSVLAAPLALADSVIEAPVSWVLALLTILAAFQAAGAYLQALHSAWLRFSFLLGLVWWALAVGAGMVAGPRTGLTVLCLGSLLPLLAPASTPSSDLRRFIEAALTQPAQLLVSTFLALCLSGTVLLSIDAAHAGSGVGLLDAAFTAVSAVCVTGLIVVDTPNAFSGLGQVFVLLLIQIGGLGIMTFSSGALVLFGRRLSLRHEATFANLLGGEDRRRLVHVVGRTFFVTFGLELAGAGVLTAAFSERGDTLGAAAWRGLFTAISAFCNAGFALQTDSLIPYQSDPLVLHTVGLLIILGGLSPLVVWLSVSRLWKRRPERSLFVSIVLLSTAFLLVVGAIGYLGMEWEASLRGLGLVDRLHNAWFQSITLRTAGFNSVDLTTTRPATQTLMIVMMFIGAAPGGTAGGIKVTTAFVLILAVWSTMRGRTTVTSFGRTISHRSVYRAAAIATFGLASNLAVYMALQLTQHMDSELALFETVSALGTVGLSIGATALLDDVGKIIVMVAMFMGRVGPLTTVLFLADRVSGAPWVQPEEHVDVG